MDNIFSLDYSFSNESSILGVVFGYTSFLISYIDNILLFYDIVSLSDLGLTSSYFIHGFNGILSYKAVWFQKLQKCDSEVKVKNDCKARKEGRGHASANTGKNMSEVRIEINNTNKTKR